VGATAELNVQCDRLLQGLSGDGLPCGGKDLQPDDDFAKMPGGARAPEDPHSSESARARYPLREAKTNCARFPASPALMKPLLGCVPDCPLKS
jgi:hypothetical protein